MRLLVTPHHSIIYKFMSLNNKPSILSIMPSLIATQFQWLQHCVNLLDTLKKKGKFMNIHYTLRTDIISTYHHSIMQSCHPTITPKIITWPWCPYNTRIIVGATTTIPSNKIQSLHHSRFPTRKHATHHNTNPLTTQYKYMPGKPLKEILRNGIPSCHNVVTSSLHHATTPLWNHAIHCTANYTATQTHSMPHQSIKRNMTSFLIQQKTFLEDK